MRSEITLKLPIRSATVQNKDLTEESISSPRASFHKIRDCSSIEFSEEVQGKSSMREFYSRMV
jgi:hypothetical protein